MWGKNRREERKGEERSHDGRWQHSKNDAEGQTTLCKMIISIASTVTAAVEQMTIIFLNEEGFQLRRTMPPVPPDKYWGEVSIPLNSQN